MLHWRRAASGAREIKGLHDQPTLRTYRCHRPVIGIGSPSLKWRRIPRLALSPPGRSLRDKARPARRLLPGVTRTSGTPSRFGSKIVTVVDMSENPRLSPWSHDPTGRKRQTVKPRQEAPSRSTGSTIGPHHELLGQGTVTPEEEGIDGSGRSQEVRRWVRRSHSARLPMPSPHRPGSQLVVLRPRSSCSGSTGAAAGIVFGRLDSVKVLISAPRGAVLPCGGERTPLPVLSQQAGEAGGSLILEAQGRVGAALTTTERAGTARRPGSG
jgi:hypothetical protein